MVNFRESGSAVITNIQGFSLHDGPGIRTVVFFKGCPLTCQWCANPESISGEPQMGFFRTLCSDCGQCFDVCPNDAIRRGVDAHRIDYSRCRVCGLCLERCFNNALVRYGEKMTVAAVYDAVRRDRMFYDSSSGGVTVSGGEPLIWSSFVRELFDLCRKDGINTCVETCGFADRDKLLEVMSLTDHFLFDLKHIDSEIHKKYTGQSNDRILANAAFIMEHGVSVTFRQPLIPGINDSPENIRATAGFLSDIGAEHIELMPYHRMGQNKYRALNIPYSLSGIEPDANHAETVKTAYMSLGLRCAISR